MVRSRILGSVLGLALLLPGASSSRAAGCEDMLARHMVGEAMLAAQFVAAAEKGGMAASAINAALKDVAEKSAAWERKDTLDALISALRRDVGDATADEVKSAVDAVVGRSTKPMGADCGKAEKCLVRGLRAGCDVDEPAIDGRMRRPGLARRTESTLRLLTAARRTGKAAK